jgi:DNA-binding MarR family transcriptional regulator
MDPDRPAWLFLDLWSAARRSVRQATLLLEEQGVGDNELAALLHLATSPAGLTVTNLAEEMGVAFMSASDAAGRLERAGDLERVPHATDRRSSVVQLTNTGAVRARSALELLDELARRIAADGGATTQELSQLAARLNEVLTAAE